jgi:hypothetical protein
MKKVLNAIVALVLVLVLTTPSWAAKTRFETEIWDETTSCTLNNAVGYCMYMVTGPFAHAGLYDRYDNAGLSGGMSIFSSYSNADNKLVFVGTGVDMISELRANGTGSPFVWVLDEGVTTGAATTISGVAAFQADIPLVSGLPNTIHTLKIDKGAGNLRLDAFDVHDSGTRLRIDDGDTSAVLKTGSEGAVRYSAGWAHQEASFDAQILASGGSYSYTVGTGEWSKVDFTGAGIVFGTVAREISFDCTWNLDNAFDGYMDILSENAYGWGIHYRWPMLVSNQLAPGSHTLTVYAGTGPLLHNVDFFDVIAEVVPVELSSFEVE